MLGKGEYAQFQFLKAEQVESVRKEIHKLKGEWFTLGGGDSATLGRAWYKMINDGMMHVYYAQAAKINRLLKNHFPEFTGWIENVGSLLASPEGPPVKVQPRTVTRGPFWTNYGFTISSRDSEVHDADSVGGYSIAHMDYEGLMPYPEALFNPDTRAFSAIFSIECPEAGGGLILYPERYLGNVFSAPSLTLGINNDEGYARLLRGDVVEPITLNYPPGTVTVFDSFMAHTIQPMTFSDEHPYRIVGIVHYLYRESPRPHFEYWF